MVGRRLSKKPIWIKKRIPDTKVSGIFVCSLKIIILGCNKNNMGNIQFKQLPLSAPSLFPEDIFEKISVNHPVRLVSEKAKSIFSTKSILQ